MEGPWSQEIYPDTPRHMIHMISLRHMIHLGYDNCNFQANDSGKKKHKYIYTCVCVCVYIK